MSAIVDNAIGGLIASEVHGVIGLLVSRIKEEIKLAWGFKKQLEKLKEGFEELSGILEGTSRQSISNKVMAGWLKKIKDVAEDVNILLDECSYKALQDKVIGPQKWYKKLCRRLVIAHKVNDMTKAVDSIYNHAHKLGIELVKVGGGEVYSGMQSREIENQESKLQVRRHLVDDTSLLGRKEDITKIVESLRDATNSRSDLTVIGIVGMAGLGKTTMVKHISMLQDVTNYFNSLVIWLVVSHDYNLKGMLNRMVEILFKETSNFKDIQALISKLQETLKGKKYLLILDDVWDTADWEPLLSTLQQIGGSQGTTLLVTSREKDVVANMTTRSSYGSEGNVTNVTLKSPIIHALHGLSECDSWSLFEERVGTENLVGNKNIEIAEKMLKRCGGVPLAIRVLADLLRGKSIEEWREIEESEMWTKGDKNGILPSLRLSYNYLPHSALKRCFAFCAIFEEDEVIEKQKLICMWMAKGFLHPNEKMEHTGDRYIKHLLSCSLFQEVGRDIYGEVEAFKMHDLVWSLAGVVSKGECLCLCRNDEDLDKVRHLLVSNNSGSRELTVTSFKKLQTCMLSKEIENPSLHIWLKCEHLRVLVIGGNWSENTDWKPLGRLIHLRYFEITAHFEKDLKHFKLPDQITKLYHLQTLIINLPHVRDPSNTVFPKGLGNLVNLRHILIKHSKIGVPMWLSQLTALQTLPVINLRSNWGGRISDMGLLTNLRGKLEIHCLTLLTTVEEARSLNLGSKSNLDSLVLKWDDNYKRADKKNPKPIAILEALQPNKNLHKLELRYFDCTAFPKWLMGSDSPLNNIVSLQICACKEADGDLKVENFICLRILIVEDCKKLTVTFPNLLLMPKLEVIVIRGNNSTSRDVLVGLGNLPSLRGLQTDLKLPGDLGEQSPVCKSLEDLTLDGSKYYNGDTTDLPDQLQHLVALQTLWIRHFKSVEAIPNWLGKLTSLQMLYLTDMPKLKQLPPQDVMQSLSNLTRLNCSDCCPILEEDFKNKSGEWFKIAHIRSTYPK